MTNNELLDSDEAEGLDALLKKKYQHKTSLMAFQNLATFQFNKRANRAISSGGWYVISGVAVDAFAGDDVIIGFSSVENVGIEIVGSLDAGSGDDLIVGEGVGDYGIYNFGALAGGSGNDTMRGIGKEIGIVNVGSIDLGNGKDVIQGSGGQGTTEQGIRNEGSIMGGSGSDTIKGKGEGGSGIFNGTLDAGVDYLIDGGSGDDLIAGESDLSAGVNNFGIINGGDGDDAITGTGGGLGIQNLGIINGGSGKDTIRGKVIGAGAIGIVNSGLIDTGAGDDTVDALNGGFVGPLGKTYLGKGNDRLLGFGTGKFYGGSGVDKILFSQGIYTIIGSNITSEGVSMTVSEFEKIGGSKGGVFNFANGTLTVSANGVATFAA